MKRCLTGKCKVHMLQQIDIERWEIKNIYRYVSRSERSHGKCSNWTWPIKCVVRKPPCEMPITVILDGLARPKLMTWSMAERTSLTSYRWKTKIKVQPILSSVALQLAYKLKVHLDSITKSNYLEVKVENNKYLRTNFP